jgi:hypothetical protein
MHRASRWVIGPVECLASTSLLIHDDYRILFRWRRDVRTLLPASMKSVTAAGRRWQLPSFHFIALVYVILLLSAVLFRRFVLGE